LATSSAEAPPSNFFPAGFAGGGVCETIVTEEEGALAETTLTCALFAIIIPLTLGFRTLTLPLSHEITALPETEIIAYWFSTGEVTVNPPSKDASVMFETLAHPSLSAIPGPVEPAPVSAAVLPQ